MKRSFLHFNSPILNLETRSSFVRYIRGSTFPPYSFKRDKSTAELAQMLTPVSEPKNKADVILDLKKRLDKSWAAGLNNYFANAENLVPKSEVIQVLDRAIEILKSEANIVTAEISESQQQINVVGDTHGQYYDLLNLLRLSGEPDDNNKYVFNGDFVDRGSFSFQTVFLLLSYKILWPSNIYLLRGNHETVDMNVMYGFFHEILAKYDQEVLHKFWSVFAHLPLACIIKPHSAIVLHGGLFTEKDVTLDDINSVNRTIALDDSSPTTARQSSIMHDILWADPMSSNGRQVNKSRGGGLLFGPDVTERFLKRNNLNFLIRSHQVRQKGWSEEHGGRCVTLFSAPNYCDSCGNKGAYLKFVIDHAQPEVFEFEAVRHPPLPPMAHLEISKPNSRL